MRGNLGCQTVDVSMEYSVSAFLFLIIQFLCQAANLLHTIGYQFAIKQHFNETTGAETLAEDCRKRVKLNRWSYVTTGFLEQGGIKEMLRSGEVGALLLAGHEDNLDQA